MATQSQTPVTAHRFRTLAGVIFSFVVFRLMVVIMEAFGIGGIDKAGDVTRATFAAWASWSLPLMVVEFFLQLPKLRAGRR